MLAGCRKLGKSAWLTMALTVPAMALTVPATALTPLIAATAVAATATNAAAVKSSGAAAEKPSATDQQLRNVIDSDKRSAAHKARDPYRHPYETLSFFGIRPNMTVVELWPFGGWYTEILAPYLRDHGKLYAAAMDPASKDREDIEYNTELHRMFAARPELFDKVQQTVLAPGKMRIAPDGSADMVLTFRNIHNWAWAGIDKQVFAAAFRALKPGGILGVEEHRNNDPRSAPGRPPQAYVGEQWAIAMIESVGFQYVGDSDINRNPKDTKDYPKGVWTLPPSYAEGDKDRAKYAAIGESDRFTLKFVKPR
jgi:predicted methyltransferase